MIPSIGIMIGAYIVLRCVEQCNRNEEGFSSKGGRHSVVFIAVLVAITAVFVMIDLFFGGATVSALSAVSTL